jgi:cobalt-zinc-cadmium efflux system membrane fusion protein
MTRTIRSRPQPRIGIRQTRRVSKAGIGAERWLLMRIVLLLALLQVGPMLGASVAAAAPTAKSSETVRVSAEQLHQLDIVKVELCAFPVQKQAIGQIAFNEDASTVVLTPFSGRVTRLLAKVGDAVKRGDALFEIDSPEVVQAQTELIAAVHGVEKAKSQQAFAKRVLDRLERLLADKATAQREVDEARNNHAAAESDLMTAQGSLTAARNRLRVIVGREQEEVTRVERERVINPLITVNAPIDGTVIGRKVGPGQYVRSDAGEPLYSVANLSTMWLKANVPENDIRHVRIGQQIEVKVAALPDRVFKARIIAIGAASDMLTRRIVVRSEIPNPDGALRAEMFATFKILTGQGTAAPAVPVEAVIREGDLSTVWVEREPMMFERRKVSLGIEQDGQLQILDGLKPGDTVVGRGAIFVDNEWRQ